MIDKLEIVLIVLFNEFGNSPNTPANTTACQKNRRANSEEKESKAVPPVKDKTQSEKDNS